MKQLFKPNQAGAVRARLALAVALVAGSVVALPYTGITGTHAAHQNALATSPKPDARGADYSNSGLLSTTGPSLPPSLVYTAAPTGANALSGIELDASGNVIFNDKAGTVYSYTPAQPTGAQNIKAVISQGATGGDGSATGGANSVPVVSDDGNAYITTDAGNLDQINLSTGVVTLIYHSSSALPGIPKIGPDNSIYIGTASGTVLKINPATKAVVWSFVASNYATFDTNNTSTSEKFDGEVALDTVNHVVYAASSNSDTANAAKPFGTVYAIADTGNSGGTAGHILASWTTTNNGNPITTGTPLGSAGYQCGATGLSGCGSPLDGPVPGSVLFVPAGTPSNTLNPHGLVIVADKAPQVAAFDASTGALVWSAEQAALNNDAHAFLASPALSKDGTQIFVPNSATLFYSFLTGTGATATGWTTGGNPGLALSNGALDSPVVDNAGNVFIVDGSSNLKAYTPGGSVLFSTATGVGSTGYISPAIDSTGVVYVDGATGHVEGYQFNSVGATATAVAQQTATAAAQANQTSTAIAQQTANANATATAAAAQAQQTANANATATAAAAQANQTATAAAQQTANAAATAAAQQTANANATSTAAAAQANATATAAAQQTANANATSTAIANANLTATAQAQIQQTAQANANATATAAAAGGKLPPCQLIVLPNPKIIQQGGSETVLYKALPGTTILTIINGSDTYPQSAKLYDSYNTAGETSVNALTAAPAYNPTGLTWPLPAGQYAYEFTLPTSPAPPATPAGGRALLDFSIPGNAPIGTQTVTTYANQVGCQMNSKPTTDANGHVTGNAHAQVQLQNAVHYTVEAPQATSFNLSVSLRHNVLIHTVEANTAAAAATPVWTTPFGASANHPSTSLVNNQVYVKTGIGDQVNVQAWIWCKNPAGPTATPTPGPAPHNPDCGIDPAYSTFNSAGHPFFNNTGTAVSYTQHNLGTGKSTTYGLYQVALPVFSNFLVPGHGARIEVSVTVGATGHTQTKLTSFPIQEQRLRLVIQPQETTRGNQRPVFQIGHKHGTTTTSTFTALVVGDAGATVSGTFAIANPTTGALYVNNLAATTLGPGGRGKLRFSVPDGTTPTHGTALLSVTSTFRGSTVTRTVKVFYNTK